ncbi:MAG: hypothetical protein LQ339_007047 [Xanthoria mediterranea]|nr:MAG: hypothetical protein LQ339_007047 [Xanthoria mediterranea]
MYISIVVFFSYTLATATRAPIIPFVQQAPTPQWGDITPGVYRFVNYATGTALSVKDASADSDVVSMYLAPFPYPHSTSSPPTNPTVGPSQTTTTLSAVGRPVRARTVLPGDWSAIWDLQRYNFGTAPTDPIPIYLRFLNGDWAGGLLDIPGDDRTPGAPVYLNEGVSGRKSQGWYTEYLGQ